MSVISYENLSGSRPPGSYYRTLIFYAWALRKDPRLQGALQVLVLIFEAFLNGGFWRMLSIQLFCTRRKQEPSKH
jgi:hypothetical protein